VPGNPCRADAPKWGINVDSSIVTYKNLGGLGPSPIKEKPWYAPEQSIVYEEVGTYYGKKIDLIVTADDTYGPAQKRSDSEGLRWLRDVNGIESGAEVPSIGIHVQGTFTFTFTVVDSLSKKKIPVPEDYSNNVAFFDLDGDEDGYEEIGTCDASNVYTFKNSIGVRPSCTKSPICAGQARCHAKNMIEEVQSDGMTFTRMTTDQKAASVTFSMVGENAGEFQMTYTTGHERRLFIFKGTNDMICDGMASTTTASTTTKPTPKPAPAAPGKKPVFGKSPFVMR